ncbi:MAG: hypothetical protein GY698_11825 [Actinomycetia bacterium]|nr:hypothetical protein [Actinomycetes bacterium]
MRSLYSTRLAELRAEKDDDEIDYFGITQEIISSKAALLEYKFPGVTKATTVAAYNSVSDIKQDFHFREGEADLPGQAYLIGRRVVLPDIDDPEDALKRAIALSHDDSFREKRARFFNWQAQVAAPAGLTAPQVVEEIRLMTNDYDKAVERAFDKVAAKSVFTICGIVWCPERVSSQVRQRVGTR